MTKAEALKLLNALHDQGYFTSQQFKTIRGQIQKGDVDAALRGIDRMIEGTYDRDGNRDQTA